MKYPIPFIQATARRNEPDAPVAAPYLRRSFELETVPQTAPLEITVTGFYELFVNGQPITRGRLSPYINNPDQVLYVDRYELAPYLRCGENVLGVLLGNGFANCVCQAGKDSLLDVARFRTQPKLAVQLTLGETVLTADEQFRTAPSPILSDDYRGGEVYDARRELPGWAEPGFDAGAWAAAEIAEPPRGELVPNRSMPVGIVRSYAPTSVEKREETYRFVFPVNTAGVCTLRLRHTTAGQTVTLRYLESLWPRGLTGAEAAYDTTPDSDYGQVDRYICRGAEQEEWTPTFVYHGFNYVEVTGLQPEQAVPEALEYQEMTTLAQERGGFTCSDPTANAVVELCLRSLDSNFIHFLTDCPHREKNGWTGDAELAVEHALLYRGAESNLQQWMQMLRKAQSEEGIVPGIVPTGTHAYHELNGPAWDCALFWVPYYLWQYRSDTDTIRENTPAMLRYLDYLTTRIREDGLVCFGLGDWSHVGRGAWFYKAPLELTDTVLSMDLCRKAAQMFTAVEKPSAALYAEDLADRLYRAAREQLVDPYTMTALGSCQTSQAMALHYGLFEPGERPAAFARLMEIIHRDGDVMDVGVLGGRVLFHALAAGGQAELAYRLITQPRYPSFDWLLQRGATTLWENFMQPEANWTDSRNHQFWGDVCHWFLRWIAGIHYSAPTHTLEVRPQFIPQLTAAEGFHRAPEGEIRIRWERAGEGLSLQVMAPAGLKGHIRLPDGYAFQGERYRSDVRVKPLESGVYTVLPLGKEETA